MVINTTQASLENVQLTTYYFVCVILLNVYFFYLIHDVYINKLAELRKVILVVRKIVLISYLYSMISIWSRWFGNTLYICIEIDLIRNCSSLINSGKKLSTVFYSHILLVLTR